ncbi:DUF421 domain-containing protein [Alkaliphilus hydrothermalis]|uniref:Uncharacterized membrane protein YcaP (DUF421 family) n=1 Tax=Alkaliphilus hydrothermalis TaxID=1482730 RepID=A0ABS2NQ82_9FIRM|nr:DUF421 domain-containing protein [Alkaliphilus hydrothermalis]MBM7615091.1 uncharacterized membrane protein YcaP (DUF421 family) [Alkaliphilus hydrothermalis]
MRVYIEIVLQTILAFFSILFITRILGRQQVSQLTLYEYINGITFGSIAATLATDLNQRTWHHLIGIFLFGVLTLAVAYMAKKNRTFQKLVEGEAVMVIRNGMILENNLSRFQYTIDELNVLLRKKDVFDIRDVRYGILEPTGELSIIKVAKKEYVRAEDLDLLTKQQELPTEVVVTGTIIYQNLQSKGLTAQWLFQRLKEMGIKDIKEVIYATLDDTNQLYIDGRKDHLVGKKSISESDQTEK